MLHSCFQVVPVMHASIFLQVSITTIIVPYCKRLYVLPICSHDISQDDYGDPDLIFKVTACALPFCSSCIVISQDKMDLFHLYLVYWYLDVYSQPHLIMVTLSSCRYMRSIICMGGGQSLVKY